MEVFIALLDDTILLSFLSRKKQTAKELWARRRLSLLEFFWLQLYSILRLQDSCNTLKHFWKSSTDTACNTDLLAALSHDGCILQLMDQPDNIRLHESSHEEGISETAGLPKGI